MAAKSSAIIPQNPGIMVKSAPKRSISANSGTSLAVSNLKAPKIMKAQIPMGEDLATLHAKSAKALNMSLDAITAELGRGIGRSEAPHPKLVESLNKCVAALKSLRDIERSALEGIDLSAIPDDEL